jgi:hypothetical protein
VAPGPTWTGAEILDPTKIQSLDHPACSESLYQLRFSQVMLWTGYHFTMLQNYYITVTISFSETKSFWQYLGIPCIRTKKYATTDLVKATLAATFLLI